MSGGNLRKGHVPTLLQGMKTTLSSVSLAAILRIYLISFYITQSQKAPDYDDTDWYAANQISNLVDTRLIQFLV
jgi:hypothetical protein